VSVITRVDRIALKNSIRGKNSRFKIWNLATGKKCAITIAAK